MRVTELLRVTGGVKAHRAVTMPIAVVFAKMDALFPISGRPPDLRAAGRARGTTRRPARRSTRRRPLLHGFDADDVDPHLGLNYRTSATSRSPPSARSRTTRRQVDLGGVQPFRVDEPLLWLLHRFGVVERGRP